MKACPRAGRPPKAVCSRSSALRAPGNPGRRRIHFRCAGASAPDAGSVITTAAPGPDSTRIRPPCARTMALAGARADREMSRKEYAGALLVSSFAGTLLLYGMLRAQPLFHGFDPAYRPSPLNPDLAMNTAISFATTTTWQAYGGETTMSYVTQMVGLVTQNFLAAAAGLAVGVAFIRGLVAQRGSGLGNFWVDDVRGVLYVLLPLALVLAVALVALFIGALMVGRTPEYLGKALGPPEITLVAFFTLVTPLAILLPAALAVATPWGRAGLTTNTGAHGFTEILVAFASAAGTDGLGFAGLSANSPFYNSALAFSMMLGRFAPAILALAFAGLFVGKARWPASVGTLPTHTVLFGVLLLGTVLLVGALCFLPALALGPVAEHVTMTAP